MKQLAGTLTSSLYDTNVYRIAECYTFSGNGFLFLGAQRWTNYGQNITSGSNTWTNNGPTISSPSLRAAAGTEVSTMELTLAAGTGTLMGLSMSLAAIQGNFDNVNVTYERMYLQNVTGTSGSISSSIVLAGSETEFFGVVTEVRPGVSSFGLTVSSVLSKLVKPFPYRVIQPQCSWRLYSTQCGIVYGAFLSTINAAASSSTTTVKLASTTSNVTVGSQVVFSTGANAGSVRSIALMPSSTEIVVYPPLGAIPNAGDQMQISRSCDKTRVTCDSIFSNITRYGGFTDMPPEKK